MVTKAKKTISKAIKPFKTDKEGNIILRTTEDAVRALDQAAELRERIADLSAEITPLDNDYQRFRKALATFQGEHKLAGIEHGDFQSDFIERTDKTWIWEEADIERLPEHVDRDGIVPLQKILRQKFKSPEKRLEVLHAITRRVLSPAAIDDAVKAGLLKAKDIAPAFVEYVSTGYVQIKPVKK